jgi:hypothetical protein
MATPTSCTAGSQESEGRPGSHLRSGLPSSWVPPPSGAGIDGNLRSLRLKMAGHHQFQSLRIRVPADLKHPSQTLEYNYLKKKKKGKEGRGGRGAGGIGGGATFIVYKNYI